MANSLKTKSHWIYTSKLSIFLQIDPVLTSPVVNLAIPTLIDIHSGNTLELTILTHGIISARNITLGVKKAGIIGSTWMNIMASHQIQDVQMQNHTTTSCLAQKQNYLPMYIYVAKSRNHSLVTYVQKHSGQRRSLHDHIKLHKDGNIEEEVIIPCPWPGCTKTYQSRTAMVNHYKHKHKRSAMPARVEATSTTTSANQDQALPVSPAEN